MTSCAVAHCNNRKTNKDKEGSNPVSFHKFPKTSSIRSIWVARCGRGEKFNAEWGTVCSDHFTKDDYEGSLRAELMADIPYKKILKRTAVPSIGCFIKEEDKPNSSDQEDVAEDDDFNLKDRHQSPEALKDELKQTVEKLRYMVLEYEILKQKSDEQEIKIRELQKENSLLKKKLFAKRIE